MSSSEQEQRQAAPSELHGQIKSIQGQAYTAIGSILPAGTSEAWVESGEELQREGQTEITNAKQRQAVESAVDGAGAKIKSAVGFVTGDQEKQNEGNLENEKAQWKYKHATSDSVLGGIPVPSQEGIKGKLESVQGMVTGDQTKQNEGNMRAEKAAWKDGV